MMNDASETGVRVVPAVSVVASGGDLHGIYDRSAQRFYEEHLECFIGDRSIRAASSGTLCELADEYKARTALLVSGTRID